MATYFSHATRGTMRHQVKPWQICSSWACNGHSRICLPGMRQQRWQICVTLSAICDASTLPSLHIGSALLHLSYTSTLTLLLRSTLPLPLLYLDSTSLYLAALPLLYLYPTSTSSSLYYLSYTTSARFYLGSAFTSTSLYLSSTYSTSLDLSSTSTLLPFYSGE